MIVIHIKQSWYRLLLRDTGHYDRRFLIMNRKTNIKIHNYTKCTCFSNDDRFLEFELVEVLNFGLTSKVESGVWSVSAVFSLSSALEEPVFLLLIFNLAGIFLLSVDLLTLDTDCSSTMMSFSLLLLRFNLLDFFLLIARARDDLVLVLPLEALGIVFLATPGVPLVKLTVGKLSGVDSYLNYNTNERQ